jgi:ATP-dependent helicase/nuclease subunit B
MLFDSVWSEATTAMRRRIGKSFGTLWSVHEREWRRAIVQFLRQDIPRIIEFKPEIIEFEKSQRSLVDLGHGKQLDAIGRFDRLLQSGDEILVVDYKTSGKLDNMTDATQMLRGLSLQVPLYACLMGGGASVELLGVAPPYDEENEGRIASSRFEGLQGRVLEGMRETLRVLVALIEDGIYPMRPSHACSWCPYKSACRRNHVPSQERELHSLETADFRDLGAKNKSKLPLLDDVRGDRIRKEQEGK